MSILNKAIAKQFAHPAGLGGRLVSFVMNRQNLPMYLETNRLLSPVQSDRILDIGCGNGYVLQLLARQYNAALAGIDTSKTMIKAASRRNRTFLKNGQTALSVESASALSFADASFSKAYSINTVYFWSDLNETMSEIRRVLAPGGLFVNTFYTNKTLARFPHTQFDYKRFTLEQLVGAGVHVGFSVEMVSILDGSATCLLYRATGS